MSVAEAVDSARYLTTKNPTVCPVTAIKIPTLKDMTDIITMCAEGVGGCQFQPDCDRAWARPPRQVGRGKDWEGLNAEREREDEEEREYVHA